MKKDAVAAAIVAVSYPLGQAAFVAGEDGTIWLPASQ